MHVLLRGQRGRRLEICAEPRRHDDEVAACAGRARRGVVKRCGGRAARQERGVNASRGWRELRAQFQAPGCASPSSGTPTARASGSPRWTWNMRCAASRYLSAHDSRRPPARGSSRQARGPHRRDECPRPWIRFAKLKEKTAAERCDKWLADAEAGFQEAFTS